MFSEVQEFEKTQLENSDLDVSSIWSIARAHPNGSRLPSDRSGRLLWPFCRDRVRLLHNIPVKGPVTEEGAAGYQEPSGS